MKRRRIAGWIVPSALGVALALGCGGCASEVKLDAMPPMPRILPGPAVSPPAPVEVAAVLADAEAKATSENLSGAVEALNRLDPARRREATLELVTRLAGADAARAGRLVEALPAGSVQADAAVIVARTLAASDSNRAIRWAVALPDVLTRVAAIRAVAERAFEQDAAGAMARLQAVPLGAERISTLSLSAAVWARRDAAAAVAWARELQDAELRQRALTSIAFEVAQATPERAIEIAPLIPEGRDRAIVLGAIGRNWAIRDLRAARSWAQQLPAGEARDAALSGVNQGISAIASYRRSLAGEPLPGANLALAPPAPRYFVDRNEALRREFQERLQRSPAMTGDWLMSLPAAERKEEFTRELTREWLATNPVAARQWIDQNIISDAERRQLLHEGGIGAGRPNERRP
jgi:hypothetical protein